jgi:hypothetical protein
MRMYGRGRRKGNKLTHADVNMIRKAESKESTLMVEVAVRLWIFKYEKKVVRRLVRSDSFLILRVRHTSCRSRCDAGNRG